MRDRDRVDAGPAAVELAEAGEDAGAAVEQEPALALDEIARTARRPRSARRASSR